MQRCMSLIKAILKFAEQKDSDEYDLPPELPGFSMKQVHYHIELCEQAGYLQVKKVTGLDAPYPRYTIGNLTWQGHELLAQWRGN